VNKSTGENDGPRILFEETFPLNVEFIIDFEIEVAASRGFDAYMSVTTPTGELYEFMFDSRAQSQDGDIEFYNMGNLQDGGFGFDNLGTYFFNESGPRLEVDGESTPAWVPPGTYGSEDWPGVGGNGDWSLVIRDLAAFETFTVGKGSIRYCGTCDGDTPSASPTPSPSEDDEFPATQPTLAPSLEADFENSISEPTPAPSAEVSTIESPSRLPRHLSKSL
jgi:hypothetical protein